LLAYEPDFRMVVIGWLNGPTAQELINEGQGTRAGELAARWLRRASSSAVKLGPRFGAGSVMREVGKWVEKLRASDPELGIAAKALGERLASKEPTEDAPHLVHGSLYTRHVLDLGDGPGLIDWDCFGQGPLELDAGMFLATTWRLGLLHEDSAESVASAERAMLAGTAGLLDEGALAWHRAAALLHLAERGCKPSGRRKGEWLARAHKMMGEAARWARAAG
jgi:aminoglycoside phosphotransferase (APT) family kinase protein